MSIEQPCKEHGPKCIKHGYGCTNGMIGWCGFLHPTLLEAVLCQHEHTARDSMLDRFFVRAHVIAVDYGVKVIVSDREDVHPEQSQEALQEPLLRRGRYSLEVVGAIRAKLGPAVVVKLALAAEAAAGTSDDPAHIANPEELADARAAFAAAINELASAPSCIESKATRKPRRVSRGTRTSKAA